MSTVRTIILGKRPRRTLLRIVVTIATAVVVFGYTMMRVDGRWVIGSARAVPVMEPL